MRYNIFREAIVSNIQAKSKKPAEISVRIYKEFDDLIYVSKEKTRRTVTGFTDPDTGLFVLDTKDVEQSEKHEPYTVFRNMAVEYASNEVTKTITELASLYESDSDKYESLYKPLNIIEAELTQYLTDKQAFYIDLQKQVDVLVSKALPHVNEWMVYKDDDEWNNPITDFVPYNNPAKQKLTQEQETLVDNFLDVFVDEYNKDVLSWFFGAILLNLPMQDYRITKALIVSSSNGGSGKSTLINALANGVVTKPYRVIDSGFDKHFRANDKFSTSNLPTCRLGIYSEAYFNSETGDSVPHNFNGLDESELKSWITEGYVANEKKYADKQIAKLTGMQIIITNHPPQIPAEREDLSRRFLALVVKPSNMIKDKSVELGLRTEHELFAFVEKNAQAFANYFVSKFNASPTQYQLLRYDTEDIRKDIDDSQIEYLKTKKVSEDKLLQQDALVILSILCTNNTIEYDDFISMLTHERAQSTRKDVRWTKDSLYISSTKSFFAQNKISSIRDDLIALVGTPVKKFDQRMFRLPNITAKNDSPS